MARSAAANFYDQLAPAYDTATDGHWFPNRILTSVVTKLITPVTKVLDVGSGTGQSLTAITAAHPDVEIHAVDISESMVAILREKFPYVRTFVGDLGTFAAANPHKRFGLITAIGMLEFVPDPQGFISLIRSLLDDSGSFVFTFEPIIRLHAIQNDDVASVKPGAAAQEVGASADNFFCYRHDVFSVVGWLSRFGFTVQDHGEFVAYRKVGTDVIYHYLSARVRSGVA